MSKNPLYLDLEIDDLIPLWIGILLNFVCAQLMQEDYDYWKLVYIDIFPISTRY